MSSKIAVYVRYNSLYISLPSSAKQQREMIKFCVFWRTWTTGTWANFSNSISNLLRCPIFSYIHFLIDVVFGVAVVASKLPINTPKQLYWWDEEASRIDVESVKFLELKSNRFHLFSPSFSEPVSSGYGIYQILELKSNRFHLVPRSLFRLDSTL